MKGCAKTGLTFKLWCRNKIIDTLSHPALEKECNLHKIWVGEFLQPFFRRKVLFVNCTQSSTYNVFLTLPFYSHQYTNITNFLSVINSESSESSSGYCWFIITIRNVFLIKMTLSTYTIIFNDAVEDYIIHLKTCYKIITFGYVS